MASKRSRSKSEEEEVGPEDTNADAMVPQNMADPILPSAHATDSVPFDVGSVKDSVNSIVLRQIIPPTLDAEVETPTARLFGRKADTTTKGEFTLDPMFGLDPPYVNFIASVGGDDIYSVDKPADVATTPVGSSAPLISIGSEVKIEAPLRYSGKRQQAVHMWLT